MAATALNENEITEYIDSVEKVHVDVKHLAALLKESKHAVIYTGAGISTSAGISDFRGPSGVWTLKAKGIKPKYSRHVRMPTKTHMAIKKLFDEKLLGYVVSQNVDGLHLKSGVKMAQIAELHGNTNKEYCKNCGKIYFRDFQTRNALDVHDHRTSRKCDQCNDNLFDSIINFNESLPQTELENAIKNSEICDLAIVLGTSLRVSPACNLPNMRKTDGKLVICNLQKTPFDEQADLCIHAKCDDLMSLLMDELKLSIPDFIYEFNFQVQLMDNNSKLRIQNPSTNLQELFLSFKVNDSNETIGSSTIKVPKKASEDVELKILFNLLNLFEARIIIRSTHVVNMKLNVFKCTYEYTIR